LEKADDGQSDYRAEISAISSKIRELKHKKERERALKSKNYSGLEAAKKKLRTDIVSKADIVLSTLSGSGHDLVSQLDGAEFHSES
jgi:AAA domain